MTRMNHAHRNRMQNVERQCSYSVVGEDNVFEQDNKMWPLPKHKNQPLRYIFQTDPQYLAWCVQQEWFRMSFPVFVDIIMRMFQEQCE
jgi:hypothetical protein